MAKKVIRELIIKVKEDGSLEAVAASADKASKSFERVSKEANVYKRKSDGIAKATVNSTKAFAKQAQGLGGLVHVYATIAANVFALSSAYTVLKNSLDFSNLIKSTEALGKASGINFVKVASNLQAITKGALDLKNAITVTNIGISGGATIKQLERLTTVATKAAQATGRALGDSVNRIILGVIKAEPELLDEFGLILRVNDATAKYASTLNKTAQSLTTYEKQQAVINAVIEQGEQKFKNIVIQGNAYEKLLTSFITLGRSILSSIAETLAPIAKVVANDPFLQGAILALLVRQITKLAVPAIVEWGARVKENMQISAKASSDAVKRIGKDIKAINRQLAEVGDPSKSSAVEKVLKGNLEPIKGTFSKNTKLGQAFAEGLTGPAFFKAFKASFSGKIIKELRSAVSKAAPGEIFDFRGAKLTKEQAASILHIYESLLANGKNFTLLNEKNLGVLKRTTLEAQKFLATQRQKVAATKAAFATGFGNVLEAPVLSSFGVIVKESRKVGAAWAKNTKILKGFSGGLVSIISGISLSGVKIASIFGGLFSKLIPFVGTVSIVYDIIKSIAGALGLLSPAFSKATDKIKDYSDQLSFIADSIKEINKQYNTQANTLNDIVTRSKNYSNILNTIANNVSEIAQGLVSFTSGTALDKFFDRASNFFVTNSFDKGITSIKNYFEELKQFTGLKQFKVTKNIIPSFAPQSLKEQISKLVTKGTISDVNDLINAFERAGIQLKDNAVAAQVFKDTLENILKLNLTQFNSAAFAAENFSEALKSASDNINKINTSRLQQSNLTPLINDLEKARKGAIEALKNTEVNKDLYKLPAGKLLPTNVVEFLGLKDSSNIGEILIQIDKYIEKLNQVRELKLNLADVSKIQNVELKRLQDTYNKTGNISLLEKIHKLKQAQLSTDIKINEAELEKLKIFRNQLLSKASEGNLTKEQELRLKALNNLIHLTITQIEANKENLNILKQTNPILDAQIKDLQIRKQSLQEEASALSNRITALEDIRKIEAVNIDEKINAVKEEATLEFNRRNKVLAGLQEELEANRRIINESLNYNKIQEAKVAVQRILNNIRAEELASLRKQRDLFIELVNLEAKREKAPITFGIGKLKGAVGNVTTTFNTLSKIYNSAFNKNEENSKKILEIEKRTQEATYKANLALINAKLKVLEIEKERLKAVGSIEQKQANEVEILNAKAERSQLELERQAQILDILEKQHELNVQDLNFGDQGFTQTVGEELRRVREQFRKNMLSDTKFVVKLMTDPINKVVDTLLNGLASGTKTIKEAVLDTLRAGFESVRDIIIKKVADSLKKAILDAIIAQFPILKGIFQTPQEVLAASNVNLERTITTQLVPALRELTTAITSKVGPTSSLIGASSGSGSIFDILSSVGSSVFSGIGNSGSVVVNNSASAISDLGSSIADAFASFPTFALGGIATSPSIVGEAGVPEAVVPLPDGKTIPVQVQGGAASNQIGIQINIDVSSQGQASQTVSTSGDSQLQRFQNLGEVISSAVKAELINQQRPGGLLN